MVSQIYSDKLGNLGTISIFVLYSIFSINSILVNNYMHKLSIKIILMWSAFGYTVYIASGIWVSLCEPDIDQKSVCSKSVLYFIVIFTSSITGFSAALLWAAQGVYISSIVND